MAVDVEELIRITMENVFTRLVQDKVEITLQKAFADGSPLAKKLQERIEAGFDRFFQPALLA